MRIQYVRQSFVHVRPPMDAQQTDCTATASQHVSVTIQTDINVIPGFLSLTPRKLGGSGAIGTEQSNVISIRRPFW
jgi:hypothetical protein